MDPDTFQTKVLDGVETIAKEQKQQKSQVETLLGDVDRLQKETKSALEDLTKVKNNLNSIADFETAVKKLEVRLRQEQRMAFGDPVRRIENDDEMRTRLNAAVRLAAARGDATIHSAGETLAKGLQQRALTTGATPGSTLVDDALAREIYDVLAMYGIWNTFQVERVGVGRTKFPVQTARPVAKFVRKLSNRKMVEDSTIAGTSVNCDVELGGVLLGVERELLEDASYDVTRYVLDNFGEAMALLMDHVCLTADGTDDENDVSMIGVFHSGTAAAAASGNTTVETLDLEDFIRCLTTVAPVVLKRMAKWWTHPQVLARMLSIKDLNGRSIFQTALEAPAAGGIGSILGFPVVPAFAAPSTNSASAKVAVFGDPRGHVFGLRRDFGFDASDDFAFDADKRMFRGLARFGGKTRAATSFAVLTLASG